jgi:hypothetical protein
MKKPTSLRLILDKTLKALEIDVSLKTHCILSAWNEIVGESLALQTQPRSIRNQILFIDVSHSTWIQQLQFLKPTLLEKINTFLGGSHIQDIRFKLGKISPPSSTLQKSASWEDEKIDHMTLKRIEHLVEQINDAEIRKELREVLIRGTKLERFRKK